MIKKYLGNGRLMFAENIPRKALIIGTGARALNFYEKLSTRPNPYEVIGFIDERWSGWGQFEQTGLPFLGGMDELEHILGETVIDEVLVALPMKSFYEKIESLVKSCEEQGITVRCLNDLFPLQTARMKSQNMLDQPMLTIHTAPIHRLKLAAKRALDITVSILLLILLLPLFLIAGALIKIDSPGPVFFIQERMGYNKRRFPLLKFRTMVADAEAKLKDVACLNIETGPAFKIRNDPRITRFGKLLRKTSLDELPQLINILRGEMSLVGPRPLFGWEIERISEPWIKRRFSMKPGLTGLWQVSGRSNMDFSKRIRLDLQYIDNWSIWMDLMIILKTVPAVLLGRGAE